MDLSRDPRPKQLIIAVKIELPGGGRKWHEAEAIIGEGPPLDPQIAAPWVAAGAVVVAHASFLTAFEQHANPVQAVLVGPPDKTNELRQAVLKNSPALLIYAEDSNSLPHSHVAHGKEMIDGKPTIYFCTGQTCSLPVTDPAQLTELVV